MTRLAVMPLAWLSALFLGGIAASAYLEASKWVWTVGAGIFLAGILAERWASRKWLSRTRLWAFSPLPAALLLSAFCGGGALYRFNIPVWTSSDLAWYNGSGDVEVTGWVADIPEKTEKNTRLRIEVTSLRLVDEAREITVRGRSFVQANAGEIFHYGQRLHVRGYLIAPPVAEGFSYQEYLARQGVYSWLASPQIDRLEGVSGSLILRSIFTMREKLEENIDRLLPGEEAAFLIGVLLGDDDGLPAETRAAFRETGTSHILAVSGFNISILVALLAAFFKRLIPRPWSLMAVILGIAVFTLMIGGQASVVRAAIMGCVVQVGLAIGRRSAGGNALVFTAALMSLLNPLILWDIGFQLSFAATLGILLLGDRLTEVAIKFCTKFLRGPLAEKVAGWLAEFLLITLAAQVFTLPISLYHFQAFSWIGLIANPLVLPVQQLVMILGGLAALLSLLFFPLGQVLAWLAWPFCAYTLVIVKLLASFGQGAWNGSETSAGFVIVYYALLLALYFYGKRLLPVLRRAAWPSALLICGLLMLLVWRAYFVAPDGRLHILRFQRGAETGYFLTTPGGNRILINGLNRPLLTSNLIERETYPAQTRLDALILTGDRETYRKGLSQFLSNVDTDLILALPGAGKVTTARESADDEAQPRVLYLQAGQSYSIGDGAVLTVRRTGEACADIEVVYNAFQIWLAQCPLPEDPVSSGPVKDWSVISLSQEGLGKTDIASLGEFRSGLILSTSASPGLLVHPNWLKIDRDMMILISSDGRRMSVGTSSQ